MLSVLAVASGAPPIWTVIPFAIFLLLIAVLPLIPATAHFWEHNKNKLIIGLALSLPVILYLLFGNEDGGHWLHHSLLEYASFIALLGSLFIISGGIYLRGSLVGSPALNTTILTIGALIASFVGTTGASMLLIRPLLRANAWRKNKVHIVVFFIFIVSNGAGMLTPLGDPPLFLGFLRGVPFLWTFKLFLPWLIVNGAMLALFFVWDQMAAKKEEGKPPVLDTKEPVKIEGGINFAFLVGVILVIYVMGSYGSQISSSLDVTTALQVIGMGAMAFLSMKMTTKATREANNFTWGPILEVACVFIGIFLTMIPALKVLEANGASLGVTQPWQFFWASGLLSSFLDNAPTYVAFASLAVGVLNEANPTLGLTADNLGGLVTHGAALLTAISCGAVFMGANTYIGNGPNFMVKAIAEENHVKMPSFFGYMAWSFGILVPMFVIVTFIFFI